MRANVSGARKSYFSLQSKLEHMPIDREEFERGSPEALDVGEGTHAETVLEFLVENDSKAYTQSEIHDEVGIKRGSLGAVLSRLEDADLVRHKGKYWAVSESAKQALDDAGDGMPSAWKLL